jgi:peptide/nickel transport system permease protein
MSATDAVILAHVRPRRTSGIARRWLLLARRQPLGVVGAVLILAFAVIAVIAPWITPHDPRAFAGPRLQSPGGDFVLGTNNLGQDVLSRTIYGTQVSLVVGIASVMIGTVIGSLLGLLGGYFGRWPDMLIQRMNEIIAAFPGLILLLVVVSALGRPHVSRDAGMLELVWQLRVIIIGIAILFVFASTRILRAAVVAERHSMYVDAARACGAGWARIVFLHILRNVTAYIIVSISVTLGLAILLEATLSFLGYGVPPGTPSWGADLSGPNRQFFLQAPWLVLVPGGAISLMVLGFNLLGDALRDVLDPRLRGGR